MNAEAEGSRIQDLGSRTRDPRLVFKSRDPVRWKITTVVTSQSEKRSYTMRGHRDLLVWQKSMDLVSAVYALTRSFPPAERYGLCSQMQRAVVSIPSNIAEGHALKQSQAYDRHLAIACGSLAELETQLEIATRLGYVTAQFAELEGQIEEVGRMLFGLRRSLRAAG